MIVKSHRSHEGKKIIAICDKEILGKKIEEDKKQLDLCSSFYKGEEKHPDEIKKMMHSAYIINAVGEKTINFLIREKMISKESIKKISNVPYAQVMIDA